MVLRIWPVIMLLILVSCSNQTSGNQTGELKVYYLDVGQGDATYIKTPAGEDILIDGGNNGAGSDVVKDLQQLGVDDLEVLISTHPDADHVGGLDNVLEAFKVKQVYAPKVSHTTETFTDFLTAVRDQGLKIKSAKAGVTLPLQGVAATFIGPTKAYAEDDLNNWSAVLRLQYKDTAFLFTGDAEEKSEQDMIDSQQNVTADVYKVGHHGSSTSTSTKFLTAIKPKYAVISVGKDNRYGHPTDETLTKLTAANVKTFRTDEQGTIVATSDGQTIKFNAREIQEIQPQTASIKTIDLVNVDLEKEIVTVKNTGSTAADLTGWTLFSKVGEQTFQFPNGYILKAGATVKIVSGPKTEERPPTQLKWSGSYIWKNEGDPAELRNEGGEIIDKIN